MADKEKKPLLLTIFIVLLTGAVLSCLGLGAYLLVFAPDPTATPTSTPVPSSTPTVPPTPSPTPYDLSSLPDYVQEFLQNESYDEAIQWFKDNDWKYREVDGYGDSVNAPPTVSLKQKKGDCYEIVTNFSLLGEKLGHKKYVVGFVEADEVDDAGHAIYIYKDPSTELWGFINGYDEHGLPGYKTPEELITSFLSDKLDGKEDSLSYYWTIFDWDIMEEQGIDWIRDSNPLRSEYGIKAGKYIPK